MQESPFYQQVIERGIERGIEQGIERGIERGIEQGETRAKRDALLKLLSSHFDAVPEARIRQIERIETAARLDALFDQALTAKSLDDIEWEEE